MSVRIPKTLLTKELRSQLASDLWVEEKFNPQGETRSVRCFTADDQFVYVPHHYGLTLFGDEAVRDTLRAEVANMNNLQFTGKLLEEDNRDQKTVAREAWRFLMERGCVLLNAFPGFGKTMLFTALSCRLRKKTLVLCTQDRLLEQAMNTFLEYSNARVCKITGVVDRACWEATDVFFSTERSCYKLGEYCNLIGTLIIDECHEFCSPTRVSAMLSIRPQFLICCSASLQWKKDGLERAMWHFIGEEQTVVRRLTKKFYILRYNCMNNIRIDTVRGKLDYAGYMRKLHADQRLMNELMEMISLNTENHKILILVKNIEFVDSIRNEIVRRGIHPTPSTLRGSISVYRDSKILIGTFAKIGTGFDPKSESWDGVHFDMLMLVDSTRTTGLLEQLYGRVFRSSLPIVINWVFDNPISRSHFSCHGAWYKTYTNATFLDLMKPVNVQKTLRVFEAGDGVDPISKDD
jgi:superfamily II DNA or RNA helicase